MSSEARKQKSTSGPGPAFTQQGENRTNQVAGAASHGENVPPSEEGSTTDGDYDGNVSESVDDLSIDDDDDEDEDFSESEDDLLTDDDDSEAERKLSTFNVPRNRLKTVSIPVGSKPFYLKIVHSRSPKGSPRPPSHKHSQKGSAVNSRLAYTPWLLLTLAGVSIPSYLLSGYGYTSSSSFCNMVSTENRDFNHYYGVSPSRNHFTAHGDDGCNSSIVFKSVLPPAIVDSQNSPMSFAVLSKYGTGKTRLRCLYWNSLQSSEHLKVLVSNQQVNEYLETYVSESPSNENALAGWSEQEFAQMILSLSVTQLVNTFEKERFELPNMFQEEKIELLTIVCYYYNDRSISKLETFVNAFLRKSAAEVYTAEKADSRILERNSYRDKPLLLHFKHDLKKLNTLSKEQKKLELLLGVVEGEGYHNAAVDRTLSDSVFRSLTQFVLFMKNDVGRAVVLVIDGIDENRYFFREERVDEVSLNLFYRSSLGSEILSSVMAQKFYLGLFYLEMDGMNITDTIVRKDKFPVYTIDWNSKLLIDYADYVLGEMNRDASTSRCKPLPEFKKLVDHSDEAIDSIIAQVPTPKQFQLFMVELIREMNKCAKDVREPFIATHDNVQKALTKSVKSSH